MYKIYLVKVNQMKSLLVDLFGELVENVYVEFYAFSMDDIKYTYSKFENKMKEITFDEYGFDFDCGHVIVIEFKNGSLVDFSGTTSGGSTAKYTIEHEKIDVLPERIEF